MLAERRRRRAHRLQQFLRLSGATKKRQRRARLFPADVDLRMLAGRFFAMPRMLFRHAADRPLIRRLTPITYGAQADYRPPAMFFQDSRRAAADTGLLRHASRNDSLPLFATPLS